MACKLAGRNLHSPDGSCKMFAFRPRLAMWFLFKECCFNAGFWRDISEANADYQDIEFRLII